MGVIKRIELIFTLLFGLNLTVLAQQAILNKPVSVSFRGISADSSLSLLQSKIGVDLTYNARFVSRNKLMNADFDSIPLSIVLDSIFGNPLLSYKIIDRQLVVVPQAQMTPETDSTYTCLRFTGQIIDDENRKPLPYSSVSILHKSLGVISNHDGFFVFQLPDNYKNDTLVISHLGYYEKKIPVTDLQTFQHIELHEKIVSLPEILIRNTSALGLVKKALSNISPNYITSPFTLRAFYREIVKKNKKYMSYTEALIDIYKRPLRPSLYKDQVKVLKQRKFTDIERRDTVIFKLKGGLDAVLQLDVIRNRPDFMLWGGLHNYVYSIQDITLLAGHLVYVISFYPRSDMVLPAFDGEMYIDAVSLAMVQIQFHYGRKSLKMMKVRYVLKSNSHVHAFPVSVRYLVSYKSFNGKYYIHHILGDIGFRVKKKQHWLRSGYEVSFEMMSTDINNLHPARFAAAETVKTKKIFSDFIPGYDFAYWKDANVMVPEPDINKVLQGLKREDLKIDKK